MAFCLIHFLILPVKKVWHIAVIDLHSISFSHPIALLQCCTSNLLMKQLGAIFVAMCTSSCDTLKTFPWIQWAESAVGSPTKTTEL